MRFVKDFARRYFLIARGQKWKLRIEFVKQDVWIGVFWRSLRNYESTGLNGPGEPQNLDVWVCIVPCFPIHFSRWYH